MRLPSFQQLRAFEAAARHENFSRAADELHLTHGAISHQVRALEQELGAPLFVRHGRNVKVTPDGLKFAQVLARAFNDIAAGAEALRPDRGSLRLTVSSIPSFAAHWLAPRLGRFIERHPDVEVQLLASGQLQDLEREAIDVGIRFGRGQYPGMVVDRMMGDMYFPAASPNYRGGALPATPADLAHATLLRSNEPWQPWFRAAGLNLPEPAGGVMFEDLSMLMRAAMDGEGVALVRHVVATQKIADGKLVRLFDIGAPSLSDYYFVSPPSAAAKPQVRAFRAWMQEEMTLFAAQLRRS
ncbi:XRE family transcriptional regulator [Massilia sp. Root418]|uniref:transcriptional regulator GcvA n=1 Tax=Massilia sp. Root418 TaxID=1736532 RepID=UPI0006F51528|nr:transcriptional regulator GcvA [Massilia sp. Root418]KQW87459.1 XRE family transcriptional regulator [Massilia sp. Root418]